MKECTSRGGHAEVRYRRGAGPFPDLFPPTRKLSLAPPGAGFFTPGPSVPDRRHHHTTEGTGPLVRSRYSYVHRDGAVLIEDLIGQVSVAGDIENVVTDLVDRKRWHGARRL